MPQCSGSIKIIAGLYENGPRTMQIGIRITSLLTMLGTLAVPGIASAAQPKPWQMDFQTAATPLMEQIKSFHDLLLIIIILISVFVLLKYLKSDSESTN